MRLSSTCALWAALLATGAATGQDAGWSGRVPKVGGARHHYVSPDGRPDNPGSPEAPWDLASALAGRQKVAPGDVLWVRGGQYRPGTRLLTLGLAGREGAPVHVRAAPGERATILDTQVMSSESAAHFWLWDLELTSSVPPGRQDAGPPTGDVGIFLRWGEGCKLINLAVHDLPGGGISWWTEAGGGEVHGCLIYGNGRRPDAPRHGHGIYTQNRDGVKTISNCIISVPGGDPFSIYASGTARAYVDNFLLEDNIVHDRGPVLVGGGRPSRGLRLLRNHLYGVDLRLGGGAENEDCELRGNVFAGGAVTIDRFKKATDEGNVRGLPDRRGTLIPNKYDPRRAHLAVYNGANAPAVAVEVAGFLKAGEPYRLLDPRDPFGAPVAEGTCAGTTITVAVKGRFAAFVVLKGKGQS